MSLYPSSITVVVVLGSMNSLRFLEYMNRRLPLYHMLSVSLGRDADVYRRHSIRYVEEPLGYAVNATIELPARLLKRIATAGEVIRII